MKAVRIHRNGGPEELVAEDVPEPSPRPGEVKIRVRACSLNHLDLWVRRGRPDLPLVQPLVLGSDVAGEVVELGAGVTGIEPGDEVIVYPGVHCGRCPACLGGDQPLCPEFHALGSRPGSDGGYREFVTVPARSVLPKPRNLSFVEAAALGIAGITAWRMLVDRARVQPLETVLVTGASGGVGTFAVQIARVFGARVIALAGNAEKARRLREELGADEVVVYRDQPWRERVLDLTGGRGVDVVLETVGRATWSDSIAAAARGARIVTIGQTTGPVGETHIPTVYLKQLSIHGVFMGSIRDFVGLLRHVERGAIRPVIDRVFALDQAAEAHRYLESGQIFGKVVLTL